MRYFSVAFVLALMLMSASAVRQAGGGAPGDVQAQVGATPGSEQQGSGSGLPADATTPSPAADQPAGGSGTAMDTAIGALGLTPSEATDGVRKNIGAQIVEADTRTKAKDMVKMAEANSKKLITATIEGLIKEPPKYNHQGKWIMPSEEPIGDLVVKPESIDRGALLRRQMQKKFDDIILGRGKTSGGVMLDPRMSTSNAVIYLANLQSQRADVDHQDYVKTMAGNCGDPLVGQDCSKVEVDVPYSEVARTPESVMDDPRYSNAGVKRLRRKYDIENTGKMGGPPVLQKHFTAIRDMVGDLHSDIDMIGVTLRKTITHDKKVKEREKSAAKKEEKKKLINKAKDEATKVLGDEEVAALKAMKPN